LIQVLCVELESEAGGLTKTLLEATDHELQVESVYSTDSALEKLRKGGFDCVLTDHSIPELDGFELARRVRENSQLPVIIYTWNSGEDTASKGFTPDIDDFVLKENNVAHIDSLARRIRTAVDRRWALESRRVVAELGTEAIAIESDARIVYANKAFLSLVSDGIEAVMHKSILSYVTTEDRATFGESLAKGGATNFVLAQPDGSKRVYRAQVSFVGIMGKSAAAITISERKIDEAHEVKADALREHAPLIVGARGTDQIARAAMDAAEAVFNTGLVSLLEIEGDQLVCIGRRLLGHGNGLRIGGGTPASKAVEEGKPVVVEDLSAEPNFQGSFIPRSEIAVPVRSGKAVVAVLSLKRESVAAFSPGDEELLKEISLFVGLAFSLFGERTRHESSEAQFRILLNDLSDAAFVVESGRIAYINEGGAALLGFKVSNLVGTDAWSHLAHDMREDFRDWVEAQSSGNKPPSSRPVQFLRRDGTIVEVRINGSGIFFEGRPSFLAIAKDSGDKERMEDKLRSYTEELESIVDKRTQALVEAEKMAAAGKLASMVGHDLRGPLQSIRNATYLIKRQPQKLEEMLGSIDSSVDRALAMLEELRSSTRETPINAKATDITMLVRDAMRDTLVPEEVEISEIFDNDPVTAEVDALKLRRVVDNLLRNAMEAMPNGGKATVEVSHGEGEAVIKVADNGVGIPKEQLPELFKPFHTTKVRGMGLGLAYSLKAVQAHGGKIDVESTLGKGTTFTVRIPYKLKANGDSAGKK